MWAFLVLSLFSQLGAFLNGLIMISKEMCFMPAYVPLCHVSNCMYKSFAFLDSTNFNSKIMRVKFP